MGSVWRFPLQVEDSFVSSSKQINDLVPNAAYMLKKAVKEKKNAFAFRSIESLLSKYKFKSLQEAINVYTKSDTIRLQGDTFGCTAHGIVPHCARYDEAQTAQCADNL